MGKTMMPELANLALSLDQIPADRLQTAANMLDHYESETGEWIAERMGDAEEAGIEFEEDDAYWKAYDAYCDELQPTLLTEFGVTGEDFSLLMEASGGNWEAISKLMKNDKNREIFVGMCNSI